MGAHTFIQSARGKTAKDAFIDAKQQACWEHGHGGYTGTLAEKYDYVMIGKADDKNAARKLADELIEAGDHRIDDKWGPAGCIEYGDGQYLFFGWASS
jgi:hypothetical protein